MVSVIIPARKEPYLNRTIQEIQDKFQGDYEIIVILDGENALRINDVAYIYNKEPLGMRTSINKGVAIASGKYIMKLDAHCMLDEGIDLKLIADHQPNWVQIPTRKRLNARKWELMETDRADINYMALTPDFVGFKDGRKNKDLELVKKLLDDTETFQGSCYFIEKDYFSKLGLLDDKNFAGSGHEAQEIGLKVKRDGGRIVRNKKTWYAHARLSRNFSVDKTKSREYIHEI